MKEIENVPIRVKCKEETKWLNKNKEKKKKKKKKGQSRWTYVKPSN